MATLIIPDRNRPTNRLTGPIRASSLPSGGLELVMRGELALVHLYLDKADVLTMLEALGIEQNPS